jgi:hypothetical protein
VLVYNGDVSFRDQDTATATRSCPHSEGFSSSCPDHVRRRTGSTSCMRCKFTATLCCNNSMTYNVLTGPYFGDAYTFIAKGFKRVCDIDQVETSPFSSDESGSFAAGDECKSGAALSHGTDAATVSSDLSSVYRPDSFPRPCACVWCHQSDGDGT